MKIITLTVNVPHHSAGNAIRQVPVEFDIYHGQEAFRAVPLLKEDELRLANLPHELLFAQKEGRLVSLHGPRDGNFHVIESLADELAQKGLW